MKFKGFTLTTNYYPGSGMKELKDGRFVYSKHKKEDIDFISSVNLTTGDELPNSKTLEEAKEFICKYIKIGV